MHEPEILSLRPKLRERLDELFAELMPEENVGPGAPAPQYPMSELQEDWPPAQDHPKQGGGFALTSD